MPLAILVIGLMLLVSAVRGTTTALGVQLKKDLLGDAQQGGFIVWIVIVAILAVIGSFGASYGRKDVQKLTQLFMVVVLVALFLRNPNVVQQFTQQISGSPIAPAIDNGMTVAEADAKSPGGDMLQNVLKIGASMVIPGAG